MMKTATDTQIGQALRLALETASDPAAAAADWLARDIRESCHSAIHLVTDPDVSLDELAKAKSAFKTMRIVGETVADRRLGGRLYVAAIAAALVRHGRRITTQSDVALARALESLKSDTSMPEPVRRLAGDALTRLLRAPP